MEVMLCAQWAIICILKDDAVKQSSDSHNFHQLYANTLKFLKQNKSIKDSLFVVIVLGIEVVMSVDRYEGRNGAINFILQLALSSELSERKRSIILQTVDVVPCLLFFWQGKQKLINIISLVIENHVTEGKHVISVLQILVIIKSSLFFSSKILMLLSHFQ